MCKTSPHCTAGCVHVCQFLSFSYLNRRAYVQPPLRAVEVRNGNSASNEKDNIPWRWQYLNLCSSVPIAWCCLRSRTIFWDLINIAKCMCILEHFLFRKKKRFSIYHVFLVCYRIPVRWWYRQVILTHLAHHNFPSCIALARQFLNQKKSCSHYYT